MERWKLLMLNHFGKPAKRKWPVAALDFQLVDLGIKPCCLFDHWAVSIKDMKDFLHILYKNDLVANTIHIVSIGLDIVICSSSFYKHFHSENPEQRVYIDVSSSLPEPVVTNIIKVSDTVDVFRNLCSDLNQPKHALEESLTHVRAIEASDTLNGPCLFGLLLGYPCVYWYDITRDDDNCLSGQALHLYQVKGRLSNHLEGKQLSVASDIPVKTCTSNKPGGDGINSASTKSQHSHIIFSFTVPDNLISCVKDCIHAWFVRWKDSSNWSPTFSDVWIEESVTSPQAVCM